MPRQGHEQHGGGVGVKALQRAEPLRGMALEAQHLAEIELEAGGPMELFRRNVLRLQAVADCYYAAILAAQDMQRIDSLVKSWGWLQNGATRGMLELIRLDKSIGKLSAINVLESIRGNDGSENE